MKEEKKHIIYTAADIRRYLAGQMTAPQMHALEKAALDDPLLADAIEGYAAHDEKNWQPALQQLQEAFAQQNITPAVSIKKMPYSKWWRAAAAVLVIGSSVAAAYIFTSRNREVATAENIQAVTDTIHPVAVDSAAAASDIAVLDKSSTKAESIAATAPTLSSGASTTQPPTTLAEVKQAPRQDDGFIYKPSPTVPAANNSKEVVAAQQTEQNNIEQNAAARRKETTLAQQGNIAPAINNAAEVNEVAAQDKNIAVQQSSARQQHVRVAADSATAEVVTIGYGKKKIANKNEQKKTVEGADEDAVPSGGWVQYNNYLSNNMVVPDEVMEKNIHGVVEVLVRFTDKGHIKEIKVDKALCDGCDAEAVRLVKDGPKWEVKKKKGATAKVKVTF